MLYVREGISRENKSSNTPKHDCMNDFQVNNEIMITIWVTAIAFHIDSYAKVPVKFSCYG